MASGLGLGFRVFLVGVSDVFWFQGLGFVLWVQV